MPKVNKEKSALRKARQLARNQELDSETSYSSDQSEEYSHIPINGELPLVSSLTLEEQNMDQFTNQLQSLVDMMSQLTQTQTEQQAMINSLQGQLSQGAQVASAQTTQLLSLLNSRRRLMIFTKYLTPSKCCSHSMVIVAH